MRGMWALAGAAHKARCPTEGWKGGVGVGPGTQCAPAPIAAPAVSHASSALGQGAGRGTQARGTRAQTVPVVPGSVGRVCQQQHPAVWPQQLGDDPRHGLPGELGSRDSVCGF